MIEVRWTIALLLVAGLGWPGPAATQQTHDHQSHKAAHPAHATDLQLDEGQRWQTDASLREGMQSIRSALDLAHARHAGERQLDADDGRALATAVNDAVRFMVANCRLSPRADANLHILLGRLGQSSAALAQDPTSLAAASEIGAALDAYGRYFDHPGWTATTPD